MRTHIISYTFPLPAFCLVGYSQVLLHHFPIVFCVPYQDMLGRYIMRGLFGGIALFLKVDMDYGFHTGGGLMLFSLSFLCFHAVFWSFTSWRKIVPL